MTPSADRGAGYRRDRGDGRRSGPASAHVARVLDRVASLTTAGIGHERAWRLVVGRDAAVRAMLAAGASPPVDDRDAGRSTSRRRTTPRSRPRGAREPDRLRPRSRTGSRSEPEPDRPRPRCRSGSRSDETVVDVLAHCGTAWADVAAVLRVAVRTGAPAVPALRALAEAARSTAASDRAVAVALAAPRASARVVLLLPVVGLLLGSAWGSGAVGTLFGTPLGWGCVTAAGGLVAAGAAWSRRLVAAAEPDGRIPGALLDAWAVAVTAGGAWTDADDAVRSAWTHRDQPAGERDRVADALGLAVEAGAPVSALLRAAAEDVRRDAASAGIAAAERLGVRLVLPLGLCVLPAFVLVGVVPVVLGVLSSTVGVFG